MLKRTCACNIGMQRDDGWCCVPRGRCRRSDSGRNKQKSQKSFDEHEGDHARKYNAVKTRK